MRLSVSLEMNFELENFTSARECSYGNRLGNACDGKISYPVIISSHICTFYPVCIGWKIPYINAVLR